MTVKVIINKDKKRNSFKSNKDDKQPQYLQSILSDHHVLFVKLIKS